ncbi:MAG: 1-deoxy-D-xylulose-5-phosphate reductoisomerase [Selenomonadaceae bacterium]|nr:1-deoxy-D-xylulose-5-phosphate reductoisomerase [Selenomonadaceae bacterium]
MKKIAILGSTGSIGTQALDVVRAHPNELQVSVIAANSNDELLEKQIDEFKPELAVLSDESAYQRLKSRLKNHTETKLECGRTSFIEAAAYDGVEIVVTSMLGFAGLEPTLKAIDAGKDIALANKETLVVAGEIVMKRAAERGVQILPVDSEHGAFFQCLQGEDRKSIKKLLLTASGGPFRGKTRDDLKDVTIEQVLSHPTWNMGKKITVDSATLVNKGLEVIEAKHLYNVEYEQIQVVVHPQSIVHSMVEFCDNSIIAQLASTDMRLPIQYALTYPKRMASPTASLDFWSMQNLTFEKPDIDTFKGLKFAYQAGKTGGTSPCVFNAANEVAVHAFLSGKIKFLDIYNVIEETMSRQAVIHNPNLETLINEDLRARSIADSLVKV